MSPPAEQNEYEALRDARVAENMERMKVTGAAHGGKG